jgi:hypothetical protein
MVRFPLADLIIHSLHKPISTHPLGPAYGGRGCCGSSFAQRLALLLTLKFASRRHDDKSNLLHQSTKTKNTISLATSPTLNVAYWLPGNGGGGKDVVVVSLGRGYGCQLLSTYSSSVLLLTRFLRHGGLAGGADGRP